EDVIVDAGPDCWTNVSWTLPSTSDCNEVQLVSTHSPGDSFPFGSSEVSYTFRDVAGNTSTCNFQVVVKNEKQPTVANCPNDIMIEADDLGFAMATWTEPTATAACGQLSVSRSHTPGQSFPIGTTAVSYTIADDHSNKTVCNFYVIVSPAKIDVEVGRAITPDGNNVNDYLEIVNIEKYKNNSIVIVDRWGGIIYKASGYDNNKTAWTGMNLHGGAVPTGTYFYTLSISNGDEKVQKTGFIELVR
ncbi:MAG TPA: HYR domain-containing protein, partial [Chryseolinea sp.]